MMQDNKKACGSNVAVPVQADEDSTSAQQRLPFVIRIVQSQAELLKAVEMRRLAYGRHLPEFASTFVPEELDQRPGTVVLIAESKLDGGPLGTMRIQTNLYEPLALERSIELPGWLKSCRLAEATRLGVAGGTVGRLVKVALCKALFMYCEIRRLDWMVITARSPLDREYEKMLFNDVSGKKEFFPMTHVGGMPHRLMAKQVAFARERWQQASHPLYRFFFLTEHPDIDVQSLDENRLKTFHGVTSAD
ncbi:hypothetical protein AAGS40_29635 (plasmid) [Paraburkholderia sp. PREW-6R]|uniref:N-acyl amino acid synthase FeeM domain-containing protein n=1 Tax=Paraburkholderia sp. PREW-6R TaxID=3141544 RepID=UPI0031F5124A